MTGPVGGSGGRDSAVPGAAVGGTPRPGDPGETLPTYLDDHWFTGPAVEEGADEPECRGEPRAPAATGDQVGADAMRATVVRFGPGVPPAPDGRGRMRRAAAALRRLPVRRHWPLVVLVVAALGYPAWQWTDPGLEVTGISVRVGSERIGCGQTAVVEGTVRTNGGSGRLAYRWRRSDGTVSATHRVRLRHGADTLPVRLRWAFRGTGDHRARATLEVVAPSSRSASAGFGYSCRRAY